MSSNTPKPTWVLNLLNELFSPPDVHSPIFCCCRDFSRSTHPLIGHCMGGWVGGWVVE